MYSILSSSVSTAQVGPPPEAPPKSTASVTTTEIHPSPSGFPPSPYVLPIRAPLTSESSDDEQPIVPEQSNAFIASPNVIPESKIFDEKTDSVFRRPSSEDPNEVPPLDSDVGFSSPKIQMPIARLSCDDEDESSDLGSVGDIDESPYVVARVPLFVYNSKMIESEDCNSTEDAKFQLLGCRGKDPSMDFDVVDTMVLVENSIHGKDVNMVEGDVESAENCIFCHNEAHSSVEMVPVMDSIVVEFTNVDDNQTLLKDMMIDKNVNAAVEEIYDLKNSNTDEKDGEVNSGFKDNQDSVISEDLIIETEQSGDFLLNCNEVYEMKSEESVIGKPVVSDGGFDQAIRGFEEGSDLKLVDEDLDEKTRAEAKAASTDLNNQDCIIAANAGECKFQSESRAGRQAITRGNESMPDYNYNAVELSLFGASHCPNLVVVDLEFLEKAGKIRASFDVSPNAEGTTDFDKLQVAEEDEKMDHQIDEEDEDSISDKYAISSSSKTAKIIGEMGPSSSSSVLASVSSLGTSQRFDGQIVSDSDEEEGTDEEMNERELFNSASLASLSKEAGGMEYDDSVSVNALVDDMTLSIEHSAGSRCSIWPLRPTPQANQPSILTSSKLPVVRESENAMGEGEKKLQGKVQQLMVKFFRLVQRLGYSPENAEVTELVQSLGFAKEIRWGKQTGPDFGIEAAKETAIQMETGGQDDLDFSCDILVIGKTGVGKSATINSIFGEEMTPTSTFEPGTITVKEFSGTVGGAKIRIFDAPGLEVSLMDQNANRRILFSIKKAMKKSPPHIVLYVDRLNTQTRDFNDLPLLRLISSTFGQSIWKNIIIALTHAASAPPEGCLGVPLDDDIFILQMSHIVQQSIRQAACDMHLMNSVALVEKNPSRRRKQKGDRVLPNGQNWRTRLLLLCYSSKILSEAKSLLELQDPPAQNILRFPIRAPSLSFLLSSLLQSQSPSKLSIDVDDENGNVDVDLVSLLDSNQQAEQDEYDQIPSFKPPRESQIAKLSKEQREAYCQEDDYRVKRFQKKQWIEGLERLKKSKKKAEEGWDSKDHGNVAHEDSLWTYGPAALPIPLPDMVLPNSFDGDDPSYRYRCLKQISELPLPILGPNGWDHDYGYNGISLEKRLAIVGQLPASVSVQIKKDKKEFDFHFDSAVLARHGENGSTLTGLDIQRVDKQLTCILMSETKFRTSKNKTAVGASVTIVGEHAYTGFKIEDQISIGKQFSLVGSAGAISSQGGVAYGAKLEAHLRCQDHSSRQNQSVLGLSFVRLRDSGESVANLQSHFPMGRSSKMAIGIGLNNKLHRHITVQTSSSEQLQITLVGIITIVFAIFKTIWQGESYVWH